MASSAAPPGVVDPTKPKSYPVILSDALLGKPSNEALTAIRYNHRPELSSEFAPNEAELKPSADENAFNLSFYENGGKYAYNGTRSTKGNQYVLIFDPERKAFVLHRMDSIFHMNLTRTPYNNDAGELKDKYPHIDTNIRPATDKKGAKTSTVKAAAAKTRETTKKVAAGAKKKEPVAASKPEQPPVETKAPPSTQHEDKDKKKARNRSPVNSEDDDDDDGGGGLLVVYPDPKSPVGPLGGQDFSPAFPTSIRRFSEFVRGEGAESDEDADAEYDEEDDDVSGEGGEGDSHGTFKLPSPVVGGAAQQHPYQQQPASDEEDNDDFGNDLEKELEKELEQEFSGMEVDGGEEAESSVSEED